MTSNDEYNNKCNKYIYKLQNTSINDSKFDLYLDKLNYWYGKMTGGAHPENYLISRLQNSKKNLDELITKLNNFISIIYKPPNGIMPLPHKQFHPEDNHDNILDEKLMSLTLPIINIKNILKKKFEYTVYFYDKNKKIKKITTNIDTNISIMTKTINDIQTNIIHYIIIQKDNMKGQINEVIEDIKTVIQNITTVIKDIENSENGLIDDLKICTKKHNNQIAHSVCVDEYQKHLNALNIKLKCLAIATNETQTNKCKTDFNAEITALKEKIEQYDNIYNKYTICYKNNNNNIHSICLDAHDEFKKCHNKYDFNHDCSGVYNNFMTCDKSKTNCFDKYNELITCHNKPLCTSEYNGSMEKLDEQIILQKKTKCLTSAKNPEQTKKCEADYITAIEKI
jgi:hypothetical protein